MGHRSLVLEDDGNFAYAYLREDLGTAARGHATMKVGYIIASHEVAKERKPIGYLYREEPDNENDSGWRVFSGQETQEYADDAKNFAMYNASTILEIDASIRELLGTPAPVAFERGASGKFVKVEE